VAKKKKNTSISKDDVKNLLVVGQRIKEIREHLNLSVYDITGDDMPIKSRQHWQRIENGQKNINLTTIFKIAKTLNVKVFEIFNC